LIHNKNQFFSLRETVMQLRSQGPLHVQGYAGHPDLQGGVPKKNNWEKMEGQGRGEPQGVADSPPPKKKN
jgi:hypothetical protein